jgi:hypothetical protein
MNEFREFRVARALETLQTPGKKACFLNATDGRKTLSSTACQDF